MGAKIHEIFFLDQETQYLEAVFLVLGGLGHGEEINRAENRGYHAYY